MRSLIFEGDAWDGFEKQNNDNIAYLVYGPNAHPKKDRLRYKPHYPLIRRLATTNPAIPKAIIIATPGSSEFVSKKLETRGLLVISAAETPVLIKESSITPRTRFICYCPNHHC